MAAAYARRVQRLLNGQRGVFQWRQRRISDANRGVVREARARFRLAPKQLDQLRRAGPHQHGYLKMSPGIESVQVTREPVAYRLPRDCFDRHTLAVDFSRRAASEVQTDGLDDLAAAEGRTRPSGGKQQLVDVVVLHGAEALSVVSAERQAEGLS